MVVRDGTQIKCIPSSVGSIFFFIFLWRVGGWVGSGDPCSLARIHEVKGHLGLSSLSHLKWSSQCAQDDVSHTDGDLFPKWLVLLNKSLCQLELPPVTHPYYCQAPASGGSVF